MSRQEKRPAHTPRPFEIRSAKDHTTGGTDYAVAIAGSAGHIVAEFFEVVGWKDKDKTEYVRAPAIENAELFMRAHTMQAEIDRLREALTRVVHHQIGHSKPMCKGDCSVCKDFDFARAALSQEGR